MKIELGKIHLLGLSMSFNIQAFDKTLAVMHQFDNNIIPPKSLLNIFKAYYN